LPEKALVRNYRSAGKDTGKKQELDLIKLLFVKKRKNSGTGEIKKVRKILLKIKT